VNTRVPLGFLCVHLLFEYLRIHDMVPILDMIKIQTVFFAIFVVIVIRQVSQSKGRAAPQTRLLLAFLGLALAQVPLATNWFFAWTFGYGLGLTLIGYAAIAYIPRDERDLKTLLAWLVTIHVYVATVGIRGYSDNQFTESGYISTGSLGAYFLGDENDAALALLIALPLAVYLFRQARAAWSRLCWGVGALLLFITVVFTFSRGAFVGLVGMALWWILTSKKRGRAIGALVLAGLLMFGVAPRQYWSRMETITDTDQGTAQTRQNYWAAARRMFADSPIWGVGGNNGQVLLPEYALEFPDEYRPNQWGRAFHSFYYQILAEFGSLGVLLIGSIIVLNFRDLRQIRALARQGRVPVSVGHLADCLWFSWIGFLVPATFISVLTYPHLYYLTALTVSLLRFARAQEELPSPAAERASVVPVRRGPLWRSRLPEPGR
jgi:O-antigen ligase